MARSRRRRLPKSRAASNICGCCRSRPSRTSARPSASGGFGLFGRPSSAEITTFTRDLALLLKAGARLDDALELLAERRRCRPAASGRRQASRTRCCSGESLADAVADHPALFPPMYVALVRVGEVSGTLDQVLEMLASERARSEQMRRKLTDAMQYPAFVLVAAVGVMLFFILFVLPQFSIGAAGFRRRSRIRRSASSSSCRTSFAPMPPQRC